MLPQLEKSPEDIVDLFALSGPQMKRLYVTYCKGKHRSEEIYKDHIEYLQVSHLYNIVSFILGIILLLFATENKISITLPINAILFHIWYKLQIY